MKGFVLASALWGCVAVIGVSAQTESPYVTAFKEGEMLRQQKQWADALLSFRRAAGMALEPKPAALAHFRVAMMYEELGDPDAALLWYRNSLGRAEYPETQAAIKRLLNERFGRVVVAKEITRGLRSTRSQRVTPSFDLPVNFDIDKDSLTESGRQQVTELAKALSDEMLKVGRFVLVGHTDSKGSDEYNQSLSERRARRVRELLTREYHLDASRLEAMGMGKREPLVAEVNGEADARLNRRVKVLWLEAGPQ